MLDVSPLFVSYIECGQKGMSLTTLKKVCQTLGISADYLLFGDTAADISRKNIERTLDTVDEQYLTIIELEIKSTINTIERLTKIINGAGAPIT